MLKTLKYFWLQQGLLSHPCRVDCVGLGTAFCLQQVAAGLFCLPEIPSICHVFTVDLCEGFETHPEKERGGQAGTEWEP